MFSLDSMIHPVFKYVLVLPPFWGIIVMSFLISLFISYVYKWMTDQKEMKSLKDDIKKSQDEMKKYRDNPSKMLSIQKKAMEKNMQYMMKSMKPTLVTFIPIIIIFSWLSAHLAYQPITPGMEFNTTFVVNEGVIGDVTLTVPTGLNIISNTTQTIKNNKVSWTLKGMEGEYNMEYSFQDKKYTKDVLITNDLYYKKPLEIINKNGVKSINLDIKELTMNIFGWEFNFFGWWYPKWLGTYILSSILFSIGLRKIMKLY